jgi:hypothetical protein
MREWLAAGGSMAFEAARGGPESLGDGAAMLFAAGIAAFAAIVVLLVISRAALARANASLDAAKRAIAGGERS